MRAEILGIKALTRPHGEHLGAVRVRSACGGAAAAAAAVDDVTARRLRSSGLRLDTGGAAVVVLTLCQTQTDRAFD